MVSVVKVIVPAIIGALIGTVLGLVPFLNWICCLPVVLGGFVSGALLGVMAGNEKLQTTDGFIAGGLAGFLQALLIVTVLVLVSLGFGGLYLGMGALFAAVSRTLEPLLIFGGMGLLGTILMLAISFMAAVIYCALYSVMAGIGGTIAGALMYKKG